MRRFGILVLGGFTLASLGGCASAPGKRQAAELGGGLGAVIGAGVGWGESEDGFREKGGALGALFGALIGSALGQAMVHPEAPPRGPESPAPWTPEPEPEEPNVPARAVDPGIPAPRGIASAADPGFDPEAPRIFTAPPASIPGWAFEDELEGLLGLVHFDFDEWTVRRDSESILDDVARRLRAVPSVRLTIVGHADSVASESYNRGLSERRAAEVKRQLVARGVAPQRLTTRGAGELSPVAPNSRADGRDDPVGRARNRRAQLKENGSGMQASID